MINVAIRADSGPIIGMGHLVRCISLAESIRDTNKCFVSFITRDCESINEFYTFHLKTQYTKVKGSSYQFESIINEVDELINIIKNENIDILIVDNYGVDNQYFELLHKYVKLIVYMEDMGNQYNAVDVIINGACYATDFQYINRHQLLGCDYVLMRKEFKHISQRKIFKNCNKIGITSGGSDPLRFCNKIIECLKGNFQNVKKYIVIGQYFENLEMISSLISDDESFELIYHVDMSNFMKQMDVVVTGSGSTLYELAVTGTPSISYILFYDQKLIGQYMGRIGVTRNLGEYDVFNSDILMEELYRLVYDLDGRTLMSNIGQKLIDGKGSQRVAAKILNIYEKLDS